MGYKGSHKHLQAVWGSVIGAEDRDELIGVEDRDEPKNKWKIESEGWEWDRMSNEWGWKVVEEIAEALWSLNDQLASVKEEFVVSQE